MEINTKIDFSAPSTIFHLAFLSALILSSLLIWGNKNNHQQQIALSSQVLRLNYAFQSAFDHLLEARKGNAYALRQLQTANDNAIASLNILTKGSIKQEISPSPQPMQAELQQVTSRWSIISKGIGLILQNRVTLQSYSKNQQTLHQMLSETIKTSKTVTNALNRSSASPHQIYYSAQQIELLMLIEKFLFVAHLQSLTGNSLQKGITFEDLKTNINKQIEHYKRNQYLLLNGSTSPIVAKVEDTQIRRMIANTGENLKEFLVTIDRTLVTRAKTKDLSNTVTAITSNRESVEQQLEALLKKHQNTEYNYWIQSWQIVLPLIILYGLLAWIGHQVMGSKTMTLANPEPLSRHRDESNKLVRSNKHKAERNQLINQIRPLGEGKLYFEATELNESTKDIAKVFNQARISLSAIHQNMDIKLFAVHKDLLQSYQQVHSAIMDQFTEAKKIDNDLAEIITIMGQEASPTTKSLEALTLSTRIRARLSLAKEALDRINASGDTGTIDRTSTGKDDTLNLNDELMEIRNNLTAAVLEQETLSIHLKDKLHSPNNQVDQSDTFYQCVIGLQSSLKLLKEKHHQSLAKLQHCQNPMQSMREITYCIDTCPKSKKTSEFKQPAQPVKTELTLVELTETSR